MKFEVVFFQGQSSKWTELASAEYVKKISTLVSFSEIAIRSPSRSRERAEQKRQDEGLQLLKLLKANDRLILFDEHGLAFRDSREFSKFLIKNLGVAGRLIFAVGGPYGFSSDVQKRAAMTISLSNLTMNHHVARVVALEQVYRALTIWKGLPYHND